MQNHFDKRYWEERWKSDQTGWDIGYASNPLTAYIDQIANKDISIVIPGCGNAWEGEYLWKKGFRNVFLVDLSRTALDKFKMRVPDFPDEHLILGDFFELEQRFDLILEQTFFCAIDPNLRMNYAQKAYEILNNGGKLAGVLFNCDFGNNHPPFGGTKEEYLQYFEPLFEIKHFDAAHNSIKPRENRELFVLLRKIES